MGGGSPFVLKAGGSSNPSALNAGTAVPRERGAQNETGRIVARNPDSAQQIRPQGHELDARCVHARPGAQVNCPAKPERV